MNKIENINLAKNIITGNVFRSAKLEGINVTYNQVKNLINNGNCSTLKPNEITTIINLKRAWQFSLDKKILIEKLILL